VCGPQELYQLPHILMYRVVMVRNVIGKVVRDPGPLTKYQEVRSLTNARLRNTAASPHDLWKYHIPFFLATAEEQAPERIF